MVHSTEVSNLGYTGKNIKVGTYETGVPDPMYWSVLGLDSEHCLVNTTDPIYTTHAANVTSVIKQVAPGVELYCAGTTASHNGSTLNAAHYEWFLDNGVNVLNMSYGSPTTTYSTTESKLIDAITSTYFLTVIAAAGNVISTETYSTTLQHVSANAMAYNTIAVGNVGTNGVINNTSCYTWSRHRGLQKCI